MEKNIAEDQELYSYFVQRNQTLCEENFSYLMEHPEVKKMLSDYLANILLHKPDDVFKYTKDHFKVLAKDGQSSKCVVLVGPDCVGKSKLVLELLKEFPERFAYPKVNSTSSTKSSENQSYAIVSKDEFVNIMNKGELITFKIDDDKEHFEGISVGEVNKVINEGKICILELNIENAKKLYQKGFDANYIGIFPPTIESLRARIKQSIKVNTETVNKMLESSSIEINEMESSSFIQYRIINDTFDASYRDFRNCLCVLFPELRNTEERIKQLNEIRKNIS